MAPGARTSEAGGTHVAEGDDDDRFPAASVLDRSRVGKGARSAAPSTARPLMKKGPPLSERPFAFGEAGMDLSSPFPPFLANRSAIRGDELPLVDLT